MAEKRKIAGFVVVQRPDGAILMGQNADGQWCAPGGKAEADESPEETARRELREEAGVDVETMGLLGSGKGRSDWDIYVFKAPVDDTPKPTAKDDPDEEFKAFRWVKEKDLKDIDLKYGDKDVVLGCLGWGPRQPDTDGGALDESISESSTEVAKAENLRKALADIKPGRRYPSGRIDYSHLLPPALQQKYKILIEERPTLEGGVVPYGAGLYHKASGQEVGSVRGNRRLNEEAGKRYAMLTFSSINPEHRGQGLGKPLYEAFLAHGRNSGVTHVQGDEHSTAAGRIHQWLAGKHGLDYKPKENPSYNAVAHGGLQSAFTGADPKREGDWDFKQAPYEYMLKAEPWGHYIDQTLQTGSEEDIKAQIQNMWQRGGRAEFLTGGPAAAFMRRPDISDDTKADMLYITGGHQNFGNALTPGIVDNMVRRHRDSKGKLTNFAVETLAQLVGDVSASGGQVYRVGLLSPSTLTAYADNSQGDANQLMVSKYLFPKLPVAQAGKMVDSYMQQYSTLPHASVLGSPNLPPETMGRIADRIDPMNITHGEGLHLLLANPNMPTEARDKVWNRLKAYSIQHRYLGSPGVTKPMVEQYLKEKGTDTFPGQSDNVLNNMTDNPNLGSDFWEKQVKPGGIIDQHLKTGGFLPVKVVEKIKSDEGWKDFANLPFVSRERHVDSSRDSGNFNTRHIAMHAPDSVVASMYDRGLFANEEAGDVQDRLYEMGKHKSKLLNVRTGTDKLRALRDSLQGFPPRHVRELREDGIDVNSLGLNRSLDPQGHLSAEAVQKAIEAKVPRIYGHEKGTWAGAQRHNGSNSKVFQLTLSPESLREVRKQGLRPAYDKLLAASKSHPIHPSRGVGWVRYTESPDGIHIDEIQTDWGHKMAHNIKQLDESAARGAISPAQRESLPTSDEYSRLHQLFWGNDHPSKVLHEAFMEHLRAPKSKKIGKEVHQWQLAPKMQLSGQDMSKPPPVHMKQTYDEFPKAAGYRASEYGRLSTQNNIKLQPHPLSSANSHPTWQSVVRKFELDLDVYLGDNSEMLEKGMRHVLWGLAAATALQAAPTKPPKAPTELQSVEPPNKSVQPGPQASMMPKPDIQPWNPKGLRGEMIPIAHLESSFGKNMNHEKHSGGDFHTAYGAVGFKPITAHETYQKSKVLQAAYPGLEDPQAFTNEFKANPALYNATASRHFGNLMTHLGGDPARAAFAWRWGIGAAESASDDEIGADPYVVKYKALAAQRDARMKAAIESQFPRAAP
jgi:8-oxo-dGTP pyrophosphatase MutT (NUDIX family)